MELNLQHLGAQAIESTTGGKNFGMSKDAQSMVFQLFTKNVYSNPIGTVVREITSNCFDSHVEAQVKKPVIIRKWTDTQTTTEYISFIDFGVGMSPDRVENVYGVYFESTKRIDNTQIGGFGIGGKTPLAYKRSTGQGETEYDNSFFVVTIFDKMKYYYMVYEGPASPVMTLLHSEETEEGNGTEIRIPVLAKDVSQFSKEMVRQLYYFEDIIFEGFENEWKYGEILTNEYQIMRARTFLFRGSDYSEYMHICLGRVAYPIDFATLGLDMNNFRLPVALRLEVGDINVVVSRESIDYSESTIKMLKKKLEEAKAEIVEMLVKQYEDITTLEQYFNVKSNFGNLKFGNGKSMYVGNLIKQSAISFTNFAYAFMKVPSDKQLFKLFFDFKSFGKKPNKRSRTSSGEAFSGGYKELFDNTNLLYIEDYFNRKVLKQAYLKSKYGVYHIIERVNFARMDATLRADINELFGVLVSEPTINMGKVVIDPFVNTLMDMQEEYFDIVKAHALNYDTLEIPEDYIAERKAMRSMITPEMRKLSINVKFVGMHGKGERITLANLFDFRMPIFYGTSEDESKLYESFDLYCKLFSEKHIMVHSINEYDYMTNKKVHIWKNRFWSANSAQIMFIQLAQNNVKYMRYCQNAIHINDFFRRMLHRKEDVIMKYFQVYQVIERFNNLQYYYRDANFVKIDETWGKHILTLKEYIKAIPEKAKDETIGKKKRELSKYFDIANIKLGKEEKKINKMIEDLEFLYEVNKEIMSFIDMPYSLSDLKPTQVDILKKIMVL